MANVTFQPLFRGRRDAALTFTHSALSSPRYVGLIGVGTWAGQD